MVIMYSIFKGYDNCLKWLNNNQIIQTSFYVNNILHDEYQVNIKSIGMKVKQNNICKRS